MCLCPYVGHDQAAAVQPADVLHAVHFVKHWRPAHDDHHCRASTEAAAVSAAAQRQTRAALLPGLGKRPAILPCKVQRHCSWTCTMTAAAVVAPEPQASLLLPRAKGPHSCSFFQSRHEYQRSRQVDVLRSAIAWVI
jgi:hypothetical protein